MDGRDLGYSRAACSEFPNDNPGLHRGVIWYCATVRAPASCDIPVTATSTEVLAIGRVHPIDDDAPDELSHATAEPDASDSDACRETATDGETESATDRETETIEIVDELIFEDDADETPASATNEDPFLALADMMEGAAHTAGAGDDDRALLRALLGLTRTASLALDPEAQNRLDPQLAVQGPNGVVRAETVTRQVLAWQGILRGESEDYAACGSATLDEWAADLIARVLGSATRAGSIRRDLRSRGVAAFGLVAAA
jgi:hypothetical protein